MLSAAVHATIQARRFFLFRFVAGVHTGSTFAPKESTTLTFEQNLSLRYPVISPDLRFA